MFLNLFVFKSINILFSSEIFTETDRLYSTEIIKRQLQNEEQG